MRYAHFLLFFLIPVLLFAQKVDINPSIAPSFFKADEEITIVYDVTGTSMADWTEAWLWLWIPNTSGISVPTNVNPASSDTSLSDLAKFSKSSDGDGNQFFTIKLTLTDFTSGTVAEILSVGMLIKGNDWSDGQSEDYITNITTSFSLRLEGVSGNYTIYTSPQELNLNYKTSEPSTIEIYVDNNLESFADEVSNLNFNHTTLLDGIVHEIKGIARTATESDSIIYTYSSEPSSPMASIPVGNRDGINYLADSTSATLVLHAPAKSYIYVLGDFNNWSLNNDFLMNKDVDRFWLTVDGLEQGKEYKFQYLVDGDITLADPYSEKISSQYDDQEIIADNRYPGLQPYPNSLTTEAASYLQTSKAPFQWSTGYVRPEKEDLVIYELLIRDFSDERTYNAVIDKLNYLDSLGVNAIELMPVMEFEGNLSWGYNPAFMFATDKYYGTETELKILIDEAHKRGIAVILDIVLNHAFGRSPLVRMDNDGVYGPPTNNNVWLNRTAKHDFNVGYDFNHESLSTQDYVDRVTEYWIKEYNIDGYRFDLSKGFTQKNTIGNTGAWGNYDASRVALLKRMADHIWTVDPSSYIILEHFADNNEEVELADYGMMLWGNMTGTYRAAAIGALVNIDWVYHERRGWQSPHVIGYMESHDEERVMYEVTKSGSVSTSKALYRSKLNAAFFFLVPGPKMIWQFGELGYDVELNDDRLGVKPTKWEYLNDPERKQLHDVYTSLVNLKTNTDYINDENFSWQPSGLIKWLNFDNPDVKISVVGNFSNSTETANAHFISNGTWYDYFSGEAIEVSDFENHEITLAAGKFHIYTSEPIDNFIETNPTTILGVNKENANDSITLFPNPSKDVLHVVSKYLYESISVWSLTGKKIKEEKMNTPSNKFIMDVSELNPGIYLLEINTSGKSVMNRIVIQ